MKVLLLGYGKMGKTLHTLATESGHEVVFADTTAERNALQNLPAIDVAIEFSVPQAAYENCKFCLENGIPVVSGTTGWLDKKSEIESLTKKLSGTFFYASNYSIGVNIFFRLNKYLAKIMNDFPGYEVTLKEIHHLEKIDSPSGTAITLAENIIKEIERKKSWKEDGGNDNEISISSVREGQVPGTHIVEYESKLDRISLEHVAYSRESFARGALSVALWIPGKKGVLSMEDFMGSE